MSHSSADRFRRADALFDAALDLEPAERAAFVEQSAADDPDLRDDVMRLLRAHDRSADFLAAPASDLAASLLSDLHDEVPLERLQRALGSAYVVERRIGVGGMATVHLARDAKHQRKVALKLLDPRIGALLGSERFLAEIRVTANLQHPNLLPLFDSGEADGLLFYVMPYVAGGSLRGLLERERQLPVNEAVRLAIVVAGALDHAHRHGIVHRDLKPENILLQDGQPLVADFGIALAVSRAGGTRITHAGLSLGTPQYMSPEQAAADRVVDARSDVYSLACVLYEMLTGDPPHTGSTVQGVLAMVLSDPHRSVRVVRPSVPAHVEAALDRALAKLPADRFASAREFARALEGGGAVEATTPVVAADGRPRARTRRRRSVAMPLLVALGAAASLGGAAAWVWARTGEAGDAPPPTTRFVVGTLSDPSLGALVRASAITPDGRTLVYRSSAETGHALYVRRLDELRARPLAGTEGAFGPFVSPDGRWVGYFTSDDKLAKVPIDGGAPTVLTGAFRFGSARWGPGDVIVTDAFGYGGLTWLTAAGGALRPLTRLDTTRNESRHVSPLLTRDGRRVLFTVVGQRGGPGAEPGELAVARLDGREAGPVPHARIGVSGRTAVAIVDGWLVYTATEGTGLLAVRFDEKRNAAVGAPVPVLAETEAAIGATDLSPDGTLLYTRERTANAPVLVTSGGVAEPLLAAPRGPFMNPRLSPDGRRLAVQVTSAQGNDIWVYDLASRTPTRLTTLGTAVGPTWSPDGRRVVYLVSGSRGQSFWSQPADGSAPAEQVVAGAGLFAGTLTPDGRTLIFQRQANDVWGIWSARLDGDRTPRPVLVERFDDYMPAVSPDGRWLAYASNASTRYEIYVRPFPGPGAAVQISAEGGTEPRWSPDGRRIFYRSGREMMAATLTAGSTPTVVRREALFADAFAGEMPHTNYDVTPDGRRFVMIASEPATGSETVVVLNWLAELRHRLRGH